MDLYLIRHAHAGRREPGPRDLYRPLNEQGLARAEELAEVFVDVPIERVLSSPATRCAQTVRPLAASKGVELEEHPDLWEGTRVDHVLAMVSSIDADRAVVCSHGDVIPDLIEHLSSLGAKVHGRGCEKGSIWLLRFNNGTCVSASHVGTHTHALAK